MLLFAETRESVFLMFVRKTYIMIFIKVRNNIML